MKVSDFRSSDYQKGLTEEQKKALDSISDDQLSIVAAIAGNRINRVTGEIYQNMEDVVTQLTGFKKDEGQKAVDHIKNSLSKLKQSSDSIAGLNKTIEDLTAEKSKLQQKIDSGNGDEGLKKQIQELEQKESGYLTKIKDLQEAHKSEINTIKTEHDQYIMKSDLRSLIPDNLKIEDANYKSFKIESAINSALSDLEIKMDNGKLIASKDLSPVDLSEYMKEQFKDYLNEGQSGGGAGGGNGGSGGNGSNNLIDFSGAKSYTEALGIVESGLLKAGLEQDSKEYEEAYSKNIEAVDSADLPLQELN